MRQNQEFEEALINARKVKELDENF